MNLLVIGTEGWRMEAGLSCGAILLYQVMIVACDYVDKMVVIFFHVIMYFLFMGRRSSRRGAFLLNA